VAHELRKYKNYKDFLNTVNTTATAELIRLAPQSMIDKLNVNIQCACQYNGTLITEQVGNIDINNIVGQIGEWSNCSFSGGCNQNDSRRNSTWISPFHKIHIIREEYWDLVKENGVEYFYHETVFKPPLRFYLKDGKFYTTSCSHRIILAKFLFTLRNTYFPELPSIIQNQIILEL